MAMRSTWTGAMQMGVMTFPVKAYAATEDKDIDRHNLHKSCSLRVSQIKVCQPCLSETLAKVEDSGKIVAALGEVGLKVMMPMTDETMVKGYELVKDQDIVVSDSELETIKLRTAKAVEIVEFVKSADFDPRMPEKHYFVAPDSKGGGVKPFSIMIHAMKDTGLYAVGRVMMRSTSGKESLVLLRPFGDVLLMHTLAWADELRDASELKYERVPVSDRERALGRQLVEVMTGDGDFTKHHDKYHKKLVELLLTKSEGREIEAKPAEAALPATVDAVDALMRSIELAKNKGGNVIAQAEAVAADVLLKAVTAPAPKARKSAKKA